MVFGVKMVGAAKNAFSPDDIVDIGTQLLMARSSEFVAGKSLVMELVDGFKAGLIWNQGAESPVLVIGPTEYIDSLVTD